MVHLSKIMRSHGNTTLNKLVTSENYTLAVAQCEAKPWQAKVWSTRSGFFDGKADSRVLPIHQVCAQNPTTSILAALVRAHPDGLKQRESAFWRLPLHVACRTGASMEAIKALLHYFPQGASWKDSMGRTPLHYAAANGASLETLRLLISQYPQACRVRDIKGWVPLHIICNKGDSVAKVQTILDRFRGAVFSKTNAGSTVTKIAEGNYGPDRDAIFALLRDQIKKYSPTNSQAKYFTESQRVSRHRRHPRYGSLIYAAVAA